VKAAGVIIAVATVVKPKRPAYDQMKYEASLNESAALI
jgi:hypothetical protein